MIENDIVYRNTMPRCEPQLGKRGLYRAIGGDKDAEAANMALLWILNLSDGSHSLLDIAERANLPFPVVYRTAQLLQQHGLLVEQLSGSDEANSVLASNSKHQKRLARYRFRSFRSATEKVDHSIEQMHLTDEIGPMQIFRRYFGYRRRPGNFESRIIVANTAGRLRRIRFRNEIIDFDIIAECLETMGKPLRNV